MYGTCVYIANGWLFGVLLVKGGYSVHHEIFIINVNFNMLYC